MTLSHIDVREYREFIAQKHAKSQYAPLGGWQGIQLNQALKPFQKEIISRAWAAGKFAIFADCGLGKTFMQLEWARGVCQQTGGMVLIVAPLAVIEQTKEEAACFGIDISITAPDSPSEGAIRVHIINYEMIESVDPSLYVGVVLDESSILKNYTGKTKMALIEMFADTPFKLCCTATPSPNDVMELGNHAEFLNVMSSSEMLSAFFINSTEDLGQYRLKGHAESPFWEWVCSWAVGVKSPADMGFDAAGYDLPELEFIHHSVQVGALVQVGMFEDVAQEAVSATEYHAALRKSAVERIALAKLIRESEADEPWIIWVNQNEESKAVCESIAGAVEVTGSESPKIKAEKFRQFKRGEIKVLVTKKEIAQYGLNFQHCARQIFLSVDFRFEGFYQAVRRSYRFGQSRPVKIHIITPSNMGNVAQIIERKRVDFENMGRQMRDAMVRNGQSKVGNAVALGESKRVVGGKWELINGDCVEECVKLESNSVDMMVYSPPFASLYIYSDSERDMGNCSGHDEFQRHYGYLCRELHRILKPGRLACVHLKNIALYKSNNNGRSGIYDFRGDCIRTMRDAGFEFHSEITIWNDPVFEMQRTKTQRLLYKQLRTDARATGIGMADYVCIFRKWEGFAVDDKELVPITHDPRDFPLDQWQEWASPVWMNVNKTNVLNKEVASEDRDEKHICPLQLDVIQRCVVLWSNQGELVFSPFAGIGSEGYQAILEGRRFLGIELKESYFNQAIKNLRNAEEKSGQLTMF